MNPFEIQLLPRGESSDSTILTESFIEAAKADNASKSMLSTAAIFSSLIRPLVGDSEANHSGVHKAGWSS